MRINDRNGVTGVSSASAPARPVATGARFTLGDPAASQKAGAVQGAAAAGPLDGLLAVQAAGDQIERRKRALRRGHGLLDSLDRLKIGLLSGQIGTPTCSTCAAS